ncbi:MAG: hypothetical protein H0V17_07980 [Deltaproteobacteria bacterium]|nr:hypothetical protein [Deltaproteobacteria bacterium]
MRLGTCIALELAVATSAVVGVWLGTGQLAARASDYLATREAVAASLPASRAVPELLPTGDLSVRIRTVVENIFGAPDAELLAPIGVASVTRMKTNHGGTSLSLRLDFANGSRAAFKPEQTHFQSDPRREIAAYRVDRLLGIGHVPPAKEISVSIEEVLAGGDPGFRAYYAGRLDEEALPRGTKLHGTASWWVPELKLAAIGKHRIDLKEGRDIWTSQMQIGAPMSPELRPLFAQISAMTLFDLLIDNSDRWSGSNTAMSPDGKLLFFMDNTMSFSKALFGHEINVLAMRRIQMYPKKLVEKLRALTVEDIERVLEMPPESKLAPLLKPVEIKALLARRDNMLRWIDGLIARYGEQAVLAFP